MQTRGYKDRERSDVWKWALRLFFSADLIGSTELKRSSPSTWKTEFAAFYEGLQSKVEDAIAAELDRVQLQHDNRSILQLWKTLGDELVFHCEARCLEHVAVCVSAFARAVSAYNEDARASRARERAATTARVKGTAWCAGFPIRNRAIQLRAHQFFEYVGPSMDEGFKLGKHPQHGPDVLIVSPDLAWLLLMARARVASRTAAHIPTHWRYLGRLNDRRSPGASTSAVALSLKPKELVTRDELQGWRKRVDKIQEVLREDLVSRDPEWPHPPFIVSDRRVAPTKRAMLLLEETRSALRDRSLYAGSTKTVNEGPQPNPPSSGAHDLRPPSNLAVAVLDQLGRPPAMEPAGGPQADRSDRSPKPLTSARARKRVRRR